jgi:hypothetical protein
MNRVPEKLYLGQLPYKDFVTLQDKRNISTLLVNIKCIRTRSETKPCTNKYYIFYQYPYIVHSFNLIQAFTTKINRQFKICNFQSYRIKETYIKSKQFDCSKGTSL